MPSDNQAAKGRAGRRGVHGPRANAQLNRHGTKSIKDRCSLTSWVAWPTSIEAARAYWEPTTYN